MPGWPMFWLQPNTKSRQNKILKQTMANKNLSKFYLLGGLAAIILLLIFFNSLGWLRPVKNFFYGVSLPALKPFQSLGLKMYSAVHTTMELKNLLKENSQLKQENEKLLAKMSDLWEAAEENDFLRKQLQLKPNYNSKILMADLVGFDPGNFNQYFLINKGKRDGVAVGQAVIFAGGFLVGQIYEADDYVSKVLPIADLKSSVFALTQETRSGGVVKGEHGVSLIMEIIPTQKQVQEDEVVISSGLDGHLPKGLVIGQIEKKISLDSEASQRFTVKPAVNYKELEAVFVILGND